MKNRNCPNCGAPYDINEYKCPYCGTLYLDLSMIDFDNQIPFFLSIKKNGMMITQKVLPQTAEFEMNEDTVYVTSTRSNRLVSFPVHRSLETNIQFIAIPMKDNNLAYMKKIDQGELNGIKSTEETSNS